MANWSNPQLTSTYTNFVTEVKDRDVDLALQFDGTTSTNIPTNTIRWNSSINRWQKWSGSAWGELTSAYALNALSVSGATSLATATATTVATADNSTNIATTAWVKAQGYSTATGSFLPLSGGTITGNLTVAGTLSGTLYTSSLNGGAFGFRNKIINGDFAIDQYNNSNLLNPITATQYIIDRWTFVINAGAGVSVKSQRNYNSGTVGAPAKFANYLGLENNTAYTVGSTDTINLQQRIEAHNLETWGWGTGSALDAVLSFWVRASVAGNYAVSIQNSGGDYSYVTSFNVPAPLVNTWTRIILKITGPTAGTWTTGTSIGARLRFNLGTGTSLQTGTTNAWQAGNYQAPNGAVSWVGTAGATLYIAGVQLEVGETASGTYATDFELPPLSTRLALCQRYYYAATQYVGPTTAITSYTHPRPMRATPTRTGGGSGYSATLLDANGVAHSQTTAGSQSITYSAEL